MSEILITDLFDELKEENNRLLNDLIISQKRNQLLEKYRNYLLYLSNNCKCNQNIGNKNIINLLENEYKTISNNNEKQVKENNKSLINKTKKCIQKSKDIIICELNESNSESNDNTNCDLNEIYLRHKKQNSTQEELLEPIINEDIVEEIVSDNNMISALRPIDRNNETIGSIVSYRCNWSECDYLAKGKEYVSQHIIAKHMNEQPFSCDKCDKKFAKKRNLTLHLGTHEFNKKYKCDWNDCQYETNRLNSYKQHYIRHKNIKRYKCDVEECDKSFFGHQELELHRIRVHSDERPYDCVWPGCEAKFKTNIDLNKHQNSHKNVIKKRSDDFSQYLRQLSEEQVSESIRNGDIVEEYVSNNVMISALRIRDGNTNTAKVGPIMGYRCNASDCHYISYSRNKYNICQHFLTKHTSERPFNCDKCDANFSSEEYLKKHKKDIHVVFKKFKCDWNDCQYETNKKDNLVQHYLRHKKIKRFVCEFDNCDKKFITSNELEKHRNGVHLHIKPYVCVWPACDAKFVKRKDLEIHHLRHSGEKPFKCDQLGCGLSFSNRLYLRNHKLIHNSIKKYVCHWPQCEETFNRTDQLRSHISTHRGELPFSCQWSGCQKSFRTNNNLIQHIFKAHEKKD